jgi:hypothetical protein
MKPEDYVEVLERRWAGLGVQEPVGDAAHAVRRRTTSWTARSRTLGSRLGLALGEANRFILTWSVFVLIALLFVLVLFGLD